MSETKFTPGPWFIHDSVSYDKIQERHIGTYDIKTTPTTDQKTLWISDTKPYGVPGFTDKETAHANAKLIAAAPDMYTELQDTHEHLLRLYSAINNRSMDFEVILQELRDRMTKQRIVIEKATN